MKRYEPDMHKCGNKNTGTVRKSMDLQFLVRKVLQILAPETVKQTRFATSLQKYPTSSQKYYNDSQLKQRNTIPICNLRPLICN
jgi:hypothetical protein